MHYNIIEAVLQKLKKNFFACFTITIQGIQGNYHNSLDQKNIILNYITNLV